MKVLGPVLLLMLWAEGAAGQRARLLERGAEVRATRLDAGTAVLGRLVESRADTLWIQGRDGGVLVVPRGSLVKLEVKQRTRATGTGALVGGIVGAVAAGVVIAGFCSDPDTLCEADEYARIIGIIGVPPLVVGTVVGSLVRRERWVAVPVSSLQMGLVGAPGGARLVLRVPL